MARCGTILVCKERIASRLSKDDLIDMQGTVVAVHSGGLYRVQCDAGHEVLASSAAECAAFESRWCPAIASPWAFHPTTQSGASSPSAPASRKTVWTPI